MIFFMFSCDDRILTRWDKQKTKKQQKKFFYIENIFPHVVGSNDCECPFGIAQRMRDFCFSFLNKFYVASAPVFC